MPFATLRHFVPTFLLRYFDAVEEGVQRPASPTSAHTRESHDDVSINVYRLDQGKLSMHADPESIAPSRTRMDDLDIDAAHESMRSLERSVAQLETDALGVVRTFVYAVSKDKPTVQVTRRQLNTLHRYLFLMWCRHTDRALQLTSTNVDAKTRQALEVHAARNFGGKTAQPIDVWLQNLRQIVEDKFVDIFSDEKIFLQDRQAFEQDCRQGRLALWRSAPDVDFISSANAFAIYDGWPVDSGTGGSAQATLFSLQHDNRAMFARVKVFPVHPNLALAILDPTVTGGSNPGAHYDTLLSRGSFVGFPAYAPDIRYAGLSPAARKAQRTGDSKTLENGGRKSASLGIPSGKRIDGRLLEAREEDMYTLTPASLTARQTLLVNSLVLHCASGAVIFRSPRQLHHALSTYARDFTSWSPKQDYSRLQDSLRRYEAGQPLPADIEPLALLPPPPPPLPLSEPLERPSTPTSPPMSPGRKSRRQKRREWMERKLARQSLGLASPPLSSPAMSDADLPDEDIAMSDPDTLVDSPIMPSIEAAMGSPLIKPLVLDENPLDEKTHEHDIDSRYPSEEDPYLNAEHPTQVDRSHGVTVEVQDIRQTGNDEPIVVDIIEQPSQVVSSDDSIPFGDKSPALPEEALYLPPSGPASEFSDGDMEIALAATGVCTTETMFVTESTEHSSDGVIQEIEDIVHDAPRFEDAEIIVVQEDPFDDSHEVSDIEAGRRVLAVNAMVNGVHHGVPSVSEVELESFAGDVYEEYDAASIVFNNDPPIQDHSVPGVIEPVVHEAASREFVFDGDGHQSGPSEDSTPKNELTSDVTIDERLETYENHSDTSLLLEVPRVLPARNILLEVAAPHVVITPATPSLRVVPDIDEKQDLMSEKKSLSNEKTAVVVQDAATALRQRKHLLADTQDPDEKEDATPSQPLVHYTLTKTVIVWMVLAFLLVFAFPYILVRTISSAIFGRKSVEAAVQEARSAASHD